MTSNREYRRALHAYRAAVEAWTRAGEPQDGPLLERLKQTLAEFERAQRQPPEGEEPAVQRLRAVM